MGQHSKRFILERIAGITILAFVLFRFLNPYDIPFILDEPQLQLILDKHFANGTFPIRGLDGSQGQFYGPVPLWMYSLIRFFSDQVAIIGLFHNFIFTVTLIIGFYFCRRHLSQGTDLWFLLLGLASPLLTFYARLPWDNTFQFFFSILLLWTTFSQRRFRHFESGVISGLLFGTHLMSTPLILICAFWKDAKIKNLALRGLGFFIPTFVYLPGLFLQMTNGADRQKILWWDALRNLPRDLVFGFQTLSVMRMRYFAPETLGDFFKFIPFDVIWILLPIVLFVGWIKLPQKNEFNRFFMLSLSLHALFFLGLLIDASHPHYFMPVFVIGLLFFSNMLSQALQFSAPKLRVIIYGLIGLMLIHQTMFQYVFRTTVIANGGMRDLHVGPTISNVQNVLQKACLESNETEIRIGMNHLSTVFPPSLQYQFMHLSACHGKSLRINQGGPELEFDSDTGRSARLILRKSGSG